MKISIDKIDELAHAWGNDGITEFDAYLFLKKSRATLSKKMNEDDVARLFQFEVRFGKMRPSSYINVMFETIFKKKVPQTISLDELK